MKTIKIYFDGGCSPNPGNKYGSHEVLIEGGWRFKADREAFGHGTNNEAEFNALQSAINKISKAAAAGFIEPKNHCVMIETDSVIVRNRLMGKNKIHKKLEWRTASERMFNLAEAALKTLREFSYFEVIWKRRDSNVARFGH
jgi:ribonuclease HI